MFRTHQHRGRVLLAFRVHSRVLTLVLWAVLLALLACVVALALLSKQHPWSSFFTALSFVCWYLSQTHDYLFYPQIKFQEGGVEIPVNRDSRRVRFMRWNQIYRWSWDGDFLILTGGNFKGGAVRIPGTERLAVERLMGEKLAVGRYAHIPAATPHQA